jgi:hypothetical protein
MPQLLLSHLLLYVHCRAFQALDGTVLGQVLAQEIKVEPAPVLPGSNLPQLIINGLAFFGIGGSAIGLVIGGACWGLGSMTANYGRADFGKRCTLYSIVGAIIVGAAAALINFAVDLGQAADPGDLTP